MFRSEGPARSDESNQRLALTLAAIAGFVNSAGFVIVGVFTSHVTGNVGRFANDMALGTAAAFFAALMIVAFFAGAFVSSMALESSVFVRRENAYSILLVVEAGLLGAFAVASAGMNTLNPRLHDLQAVLLCGAMGLQNSLVTRISGAVVRTTHLTGVVTDLGIESARWFRLWRWQFGKKARVRLVVGDAHPVPPDLARAKLLATILLSFVAGSALGALAATKLGTAVMVVPMVALAVTARHARATVASRQTSGART